MPTEERIALPKSLSPASTGDIATMITEKLELPAKTSVSLPASPSLVVPLLTNKRKLSPLRNLETTNTTGQIASGASATNHQRSVNNVNNVPTNPQQFCLKWNNYQTNLTSVFDDLLQNESFVDVTLACDGQSIKAHKMVLSACSPYFQTLFFDNPCQHPIVIMRDVKWSELRAIIEFMYKGEINVAHDQIGPLLRVAEMLKIRGLADVTNDHDQCNILQTAAATASTHLSADRCSSTTEMSDRNKAKKMRKSNENDDENDNRKENGNENENDHENDNEHDNDSSVNFKKTAECQDLTTTLNKSRESRSPSDLEMNAERCDSNYDHRRSSYIDHHSHPLHHQHHHQHQHLQQQQHQQQQQQSKPKQMVKSREDDTVSPILSRNLYGSSSCTQLQNESSPLPPSSSSANANILPPPYPISSPPESGLVGSLAMSHVDDMEIKPEIAEMIREEERAKLMENAHPWMSASTSSVSESYQYQLQSMWQKCWNTNQQNLIQQLRFRERGPLKSWRPEAMAEAIFSVLKEGLSLSQAARKYDIPYPTFVLYANRVHNMLGPSLDGGVDPRPKARGRPQRILLGMWPDDLIKSVIKAVVFRDYRELKEEQVAHLHPNGGHSPHFSSPDPMIPNYPGRPNSNGYKAPPAENSHQSLAALTDNLRRQMQMSQQQSQQTSGGANLFSMPPNLSRPDLDIKMKRSHLDSRENQKHSPSGIGLENMTDFSALGFMSIPGLHIIPQNTSVGAAAAAGSASSCSGGSGGNSSHGYHNRDNKDENSPISSRTANTSTPKDSYTKSQYPFSGSPYPFNLKSKPTLEHPTYKMSDRRSFDGYPSALDMEALANGMLQKSNSSASPRLEDFFQNHSVAEILNCADTNRDNSGTKIKLEPSATDAHNE